MKLTEGEALPEAGEWLDTKQAADLYSRLAMHEVSDETFRYWLREDRPEVMGLVVHKFGRGWFVDRDSMVTAFEERARHTLTVIEEERGKPPAPG